MNHNAPIQEPGIGGPVDLAGIARYQKVRMTAIFLLLALLVGVNIASGEGWLDWPVDFPLREKIPLGFMAFNVFAWATFALQVHAGNRVELALVFFTVPLAVGGGSLTMLSIAYQLDSRLDAPVHLGLFLLPPITAGYMMALSPLMLGIIQGNRRYKRLRAEEEAQA